MNADKKAQRQYLLDQRMNLPDRRERIERLQRVLCAFLVGREDEIIGAYWPIKGEFDALPALYRWQENAALGSALDAGSDVTANPLEPRVFKENMHPERINSAYHALVPVGPLASPRKIGLPVVDRVHKTLRFHAWWPGCLMQNDAYDIPKPKDTEAIMPTLLLVPCLGFGSEGFRLGYGGGLYDRTLAGISPKPFTVGLSFANGYVSSFVPEPHDVPLDAILTDHGQIWPLD